KAVGMSGRNLSRLFRLLQSPVEVQNAHRRGRLPLIMAEKVAALDGQSQAKIAERIRAGEPAKTVIRKYLPSPAVRESAATDSFANAFHLLRRALAALEGRANQLPESMLREFRPDLRRAGDLIGTLLEPPR